MDEISDMAPPGRVAISGGGMTTGDYPKLSAI
jgi:hypothetical protein